MKTVISCADVVCLIVTIVIWIGTILSHKGKIKNRYFFSTLACLSVGLLCDALSYMLDGIAGIIPILKIVNLMTFLMVPNILCINVYYFGLLISSKKILNPWIKRAALIACYVDCLYIIITFATGNLFTITEAGNYVTSAYSYVAYLISEIMILYYVILFFRYKKYLASNEFAALVFIMVVPILEVVWEAFFPEYSFAYVVTSLTFLILFVLLQTKEISDSREREYQLTKQTNVDLLTNVGSRNAYMNFIASLTEDNFVCVTFTDMNRLKITNDTLGHDAGDKLLISYANLLQKDFDKGMIYRISGDEFIVIYKDINAEIFDNKMQNFKADNENGGYIASIGIAYGKGNDIESLVREAERNMYIDKANYYKLTGQEKRAGK